MAELQGVTEFVSKRSSVDRSDLADQFDVDDESGENDELTMGEELACAQEYVRRVNLFFKDVVEWCVARGMTVERGSVKIWEGGIPEYEMPTLVLNMNGRRVAALKPTGSKNLGAQGRIDLTGYSTVQLALCVEKPFLSADLDTIRRKRDDTATPGHRDGWYWVKSFWPANRRARSRYVDEREFMDLLTGVSRYVFE